MQLSKIPQRHERTKHIDDKLYFIKDLTDKNLIKLRKIHIDNDPIDMMTKVVSLHKFFLYKNLVNVVEDIGS